jgi:hypothetical protein
MSSDHRKQIKQLIKLLGAKKLHEEIDAICNEQIAFWSKQIGTVSEPVKNDLVTSDSSPKNKSSLKIRKAAIVSVEKDSDVENKNNIIMDLPTPDALCPDTHNIPDTKAITIVNTSNILYESQDCDPPKEAIVNNEDTPKKVSNSEVKRVQREKEAAKRAELDAKGITIESLLTHTNLNRWINGEGRTYAYIAREYVGCSEDKVSIVAKSFGIESKLNNKKRAIMYARK